MRTNVEIDDTLMAEALEASGARTKREAVELGLSTLVRLKRQEQELRKQITNFSGADRLPRDDLYDRRR